MADQRKAWRQSATTHPNIAPVVPNLGNFRSECARNARVGYLGMASWVIFRKKTYLGET